MLVVAVTGGIGAGKTTVTRLLAERGCCFVDADKVGHEVLLPGGGAYSSVIAAFGEEILDEDGSIDRRRLAARVFSDSESLARLEAATHPPIRTRIVRDLEDLEERGCAVTVMDVPLLDRGGLKGAVDLVIVVEAPVDVRVAREAARGNPEDDVRRRIAAQPAAEELRAGADFVIENSEDLAQLEETVAKLWETKLLPRTLTSRR